MVVSGSVAAARLLQWRLLTRLHNSGCDDIAADIESYLSYANAATTYDLNLNDGYRGEITRDVSRTFPFHPLFFTALDRDELELQRSLRNGNAELQPLTLSLGERMLKNVLLALAIAKPNVGYCQGMNFVVGGLLIVGTAAGRTYKTSCFKGEVTNILAADYLDAEIDPEDIKYSPRASRHPGDDVDMDADVLLAKMRDNPINDEDEHKDHESRNTSEHASQCPSAGSTRKGSMIDPVEFDDGYLLLVEALVFSIVLNLIGENSSTEIKSKKTTGIHANKSSHKKIMDGSVVTKLTRNGSSLRSRSGLAMWGMWQSDVPRMKRRAFQFDRLLRWTLPRLHTHLLEVELAPEIIVAQWLGTLFCYSLPLSFVTEVWNYIFSSETDLGTSGEEGGWSAVFRVAMALLGDREDDILEMDLQELSSLMRKWTFKNADNCRILEKAHLLSNRINAEVLLRLEQDFAMEILSQSTAPVMLYFSGYNERDSVDSDKIVGWLSRYGNVKKRSTKNDEEDLKLLQIKADLALKTEQCETDKQAIMLKILKACDSLRKCTLLTQRAEDAYADCAASLSDLTNDMSRAMRSSRSISNIILRLLSGPKNPDLGSKDGEPQVSCAVLASFPWQEILASLPLMGADDNPGAMGVGSGMRNGIWGANGVGPGGFDLDTGDSASDCSDLDDGDGDGESSLGTASNDSPDSVSGDVRTRNHGTHCEGIGYGDCGANAGVGAAAGTAELKSPRKRASSSPRAKSSISTRTVSPNGSPRALTGLAARNGMLSLAIPAYPYATSSPSMTHRSIASPCSTFRSASSPKNGDGTQGGGSGTGNATKHRMKMNLSQNESEAFSVIISPAEPFSPISIHGLSTLNQQDKNSGTWKGWQTLLGGESPRAVKSPHPHPSSSPKSTGRRGVMDNLPSFHSMSFNSNSGSNSVQSSRSNSLNLSNAKKNSEGVPMNIPKNIPNKVLTNFPKNGQVSLLEAAFLSGGETMSMFTGRRCKSGNGGGNVFGVADGRRRSGSAGSLASSINCDADTNISELNIYSSCSNDSTGKIGNNNIFRSTSTEGITFGCNENNTDTTNTDNIKNKNNINSVSINNENAEKNGDDLGVKEDFKIETNHKSNKNRMGMRIRSNEFDEFQISLGTVRTLHDNGIIHETENENVVDDTPINTPRRSGSSTGSAAPTPRSADSRTNNNTSAPNTPHNPDMILRTHSTPPASKIAQLYKSPHTTPPQQNNLPPTALSVEKVIGSNQQIKNKNEDNGCVNAAPFLDSDMALENNINRQFTAAAGETSDVLGGEPVKEVGEEITSKERSRTPLGGIGSEESKDANGVQDTCNVVDMNPRVGVTAGDAVKDGAVGGVTGGNGGAGVSTCTGGSWTKRESDPKSGPFQLDPTYVFGEDAEGENGMYGIPDGHSSSPSYSMSSTSQPPFTFLFPNSFISSSSTVSDASPTSPPAHERISSDNGTAIKSENTDTTTNNDNNNLESSQYENGSKAVCKNIIPAQSITPLKDSNADTSTSTPFQSTSCSSTAVRSTPARYTPSLSPLVIELPPSSFSLLSPLTHPSSTSSSSSSKNSNNSFSTTLTVVTTSSNTTSDIPIPTIPPLHSPSFQDRQNSLSENSTNPAKSKVPPLSIKVDTNVNKSYRILQMSRSEDVNNKSSLDNGNYNGSGIAIDHENEIENKYMSENETIKLSGRISEMEEPQKIVMLPLNSLFVKNKSCQQTLIQFGRLIAACQTQLAGLAEGLDDARMAEEEALEWKESLCYQLLRLTQDAYVSRGSVLRSVTQSYELN